MFAPNRSMNMKIHRNLMLVCLLLMASISYAQSETIVVGKKADGTDLKAQCYTFPQRVETFSMSDKGDYLCVSFRETTKSGKYLKNKGEIGFYDTKSSQLLWKQPIDFSKSRITCLSEGVLITEIGSKISLLSKETGAKRWEASLFPVYVDDSLGLVLGYNSPTSNKLRAVNLKFGNDLWENKIPHQYGWNEVLDLEQNKRLIVADALHKLDFMTGELLTYPGKPGAHDTKAALLQGLAAVAVGVAGGVATGGAYYYSYVPIANNTITGLTSNILSQDSLYYWADRQHISCMDTAFNVVWQTEFPDVKASRSKLFVQDDKLFMLNYGYGLREGASRKKYGRPFIACYNLLNGEEIFFNQLSVKKDMIEDALRTDDALYMLFDDGMAYQELTDSIVNIVPWDTKQYGKLEAMLPGTFYAANKDTTAFKSLAFDGEHCLVYNDQGVIYEVDKDLNIRSTYERERIYSPNIQLKDYLCIGNRGDYWFIHEMGMPVAHLDTEFKKGRVIDNKLLLLNNENQFLFIDLDEAIE